MPREVPRLSNRPNRCLAAAAVAVLAGLLTALLAGCDDVPPPEADQPQPPARLSGTPTYDPQAEPAEAVLPLVPADATSLVVTDLDEVRRQLGVPGLTGADPMTDRARFWQAAARQAPLLTEGLPGRNGPRATSPTGLGEDDVDWEAQFTGPSGTGYVIALRPDLDLAPVRRAVAEGIAGLPGATLEAARHLLVSGTTDDPARSWATDPVLVGLVGEEAEATYVRRGCVPLAEALPAVAEPGVRARLADAVEDLEPLDAFAVAFGDHLATVRMARDRADLFGRLHLADRGTGSGPAAPAFRRAFRAGVGDPASGRIGYAVPRPPLAARLVLDGRLPFAVCAQ